MNLLKFLKTKAMNKKQLELDGTTALRLYPTAAPEFKELLEQNFGKEFFTQKVMDRVNNYNDILTMLNVDDKKDVIRIEGFDEGDHEFVKNLIKKVRISKVYNEGKVFKRGDKRWYNWYDVSSGFVFVRTTYGDTRADTGSASRLSLKDRESCIDVSKKFKDIDEAFIDLK